MRLAVLCPDPEGPVARHRVRALLPHLAAAGFTHIDIRAIPKGWRARRALAEDVVTADLVLLVRKLFTRLELSWFRASARRLVFDLDDAVMQRDPFRGRPRSLVRERRFRAVVQAADLVLAGNAELLARTEAAARGATPVRPAPTAIDTEKYVPYEVRPERVRIGWIGSRSTLAYLRGIAAPLERVLRARPDVRFTVMADAAPDLPFDVDLVPWSESAELPFLHSLSVGVMPLSDDAWSRGKCGFKLLQYMACGVPAVASPVGVNTQIADGGDAALLAEDAATWEAALLRLLDDSALSARLSEAGRAHVAASYATRVVGPRVAALLAACARGEGV